jgi:hypothetical protein
MATTIMFRSADVRRELPATLTESPTLVVDTVPRVGETVVADGEVLTVTDVLHLFDARPLPTIAVTLARKA